MGTPTDVKAWPILVGGEFARRAQRETIDVTNPATGELVGTVPRCRADGRRRRRRGRPARLRELARTPTRSSARAACSALADADRRARRGAGDARRRRERQPDPRDARRRPDRGRRSCATSPGSRSSCAARRSPATRVALNYTLMQPFGVVGRIVPFNHPLMFAAGKTAAPLIAGNTVVVKPSEHTSTSALRLAELAARCCRRASFNVVTGYGDEAGDALVTHPDVRRIAFTGLGRDRPRDPAAGGHARRSRPSRSSSAARTRSSCSTTPTSRPRSTARCAA